MIKKNLKNKKITKRPAVAILAVQGSNDTPQDLVGHVSQDVMNIALEAIGRFLSNLGMTFVHVSSGSDDVVFDLDNLKEITETLFDEHLAGRKADNQSNHVEGTPSKSSISLKEMLDGIKDDFNQKKNQ